MTNNNDTIATPLTEEADHDANCSCWQRGYQQSLERAEAAEARVRVLDPTRTIPDWQAYYDSLPNWRARAQDAETRVADLQIFAGGLQTGADELREERDQFKAVWEKSERAGDAWAREARASWGRVLALRAALQLAHDRMDDLNVHPEMQRLFPDLSYPVLCVWCKVRIYDAAQGVQHREGCPMLAIRLALSDNTG